MTLLGLGLFLTNTHWPEDRDNAAPSLDTVTLHFDLVANAPPSGLDQVLEYNVPGPNAAPSIGSVLLEFDFSPAPQGQDQHMTYAVEPAP